MINLYRKHCPICFKRPCKIQDINNISIMCLSGYSTHYRLASYLDFTYEEFVLKNHMIYNHKNLCDIHSFGKKTSINYVFGLIDDLKNELDKILILL